MAGSRVRHSLSRDILEKDGIAALSGNRQAALLEAGFAASEAVIEIEDYG